MISILLSCYNSNFEYLKEQIDSIIRQTEPDWELLVYNDGTNDLKPFIEKYNDKRIKYFDEGHLGYAKAYNYLLHKANGEYICFCDHDDIWVDEKLATEKGYLDNYPNVDCVFGFLHWFGETEKIETFDIEDKDISRELPFWQPIKNATAMFRKSRFGEQDSPLQQCGDYWFWSKHWDRHYHLMPYILVHYRRHAGEMTKDKRAFREQTALIIQRNMKSFGLNFTLDTCKALDRYSKTYDKALKEFIQDNIEELK